MSGPIQRAQIADATGNLVTGGNPFPITGTLSIIPVGSTNRFFTSGTTGSTAFTPQIAIGFTSLSLVIKNDGSAALDFSFNGATVHGTLNANESLSLDNKAETNIYFRSTTIGQTYRLFAW